MYKLSGLVLEARDDNGTLLRTMFPDPEALPAMVKEAAELPDVVRDALPDDVFALVMSFDDGALRKYACVDAGHTALNTLYFMETHHRLPPQMQKVAASRLVHFCTQYDIEPPERLKKLAFGSLLGAGMTAVSAGVEGVNAARKIGGKMQVAKQAKGIVNPAILRA